jgi:hypothetical protein
MGPEARSVSSTVRSFIARRSAGTALVSAISLVTLTRT